MAHPHVPTDSRRAQKIPVGCMRAANHDEEPRPMAFGRRGRCGIPGAVGGQRCRALKTTRAIRRIKSVRLAVSVRTDDVVLKWCATPGGKL